MLIALPCTSDRCVADAIGSKLSEALVPMAPMEWVKKPTAWLSNHDIEAKVREIFKAHPSYRFLGVFPMDAEHKDGQACVSKELCGYHPLKDKDEHPVFAAVFNTDYHTSGGSHWVAVMGFLCRTEPRYGLYYYDSTGNPPTDDINEFITRISNELQANDTNFPYVFNDTCHQTGNTECGMFCIAFIDNMVSSKKTFKEVCESMPGDEEMIKLRKEYFEYPSRSQAGGARLGRKLPTAKGGARVVRKAPAAKGGKPRAAAAKTKAAAVSTAKPRAAAKAKTAAASTAKPRAAAAKTKAAAVSTAKPRAAAKTKTAAASTAKPRAAAKTKAAAVSTAKPRAAAKTKTGGGRGASK